MSELTVPEPRGVGRAEGTAEVPNPRARRRRIGGVILMLTGLLVSAGVFAAPASANTPSDWSKNISGIEVGWTHDHAWVIASYGTIIKVGAGAVAGALCGAASGEPGFPNPVSMLCARTVRQIVGDLVAGHPALTNHGIWIARYVIGRTGTTSGTW
ncbi:hypothetical protein [Actinophytocola sp.]|uniref:hypothetical protein n=1 Tax=Actinophytocola sp. TaxID=1872138 RepID=UPI0038999073